MIQPTPLLALSFPGRIVIWTAETRQVHSPSSNSGMIALALQGSASVYGLHQPAGCTMPCSVRVFVSQQSILSDRRGLRCRAC